VARRLRFIPEGGSLVEVTCRTIHGRFLLRPSRRLNEVIAGVLGRALSMYSVRLHAPVFLSNHYHMLLSVPDARTLAVFMNYFNSNVAREAGRLADWRERFWSRRYQAIPVSDEPEAQIARLEYILAHGVKEGLVSHPFDWPGLHCAEALAKGRRIEGVWIDRTKSYNARRAREAMKQRDVESRYEVSLEPLPCWAHLDEAEYRRRIVEIIDRITDGVDASDLAASLPASHHDRPRRWKRSPAPWFHCASRKVRLDLLDAYRWFTSAFREASARLKRGDPLPGFPVGSFPPSLPFVVTLTCSPD
jgi:REP element-mobilizing transposase RayT